MKAFTPVRRRPSDPCHGLLAPTRRRHYRRSTRFDVPAKRSDRTGSLQDLLIMKRQASFRQVLALILLSLSHYQCCREVFTIIFVVMVLSLVGQVVLLLTLRR